MLTDGGQITDKNQFEDDQGINPDEDDAKEIENGEFCKPPLIVRKPITKSNAASSTLKTAPTTGSKRPATPASASDEPESQPKKKATKVKA